MENKDFPSNARKHRQQEEKKLEKVISGGVRQQKKSLTRKFAETFLEDDTRSVGGYVFYDVLVPAFKSMLSDMVSGGIEMLLFGERRGSRTRREGGRSFTSYGSYYRTSDRNDRGERGRFKDISPVGRSRHEFDEIVLETRGEAEEVLSHMVDLTIDYGMASVADLYDLVGITSNFTDNKYGWSDLRNASVSRTRGGYVINLPRTQQLD